MLTLRRRSWPRDWRPSMSYVRSTQMWCSGTGKVAEAWSLAKHWLNTYLTPRRSRGINCLCASEIRMTTWKSFIMRRRTPLSESFFLSARRAVLVISCLLRLGLKMKQIVSNVEHKDTTNPTNHPKTTKTTKLSTYQNISIIYVSLRRFLEKFIFFISTEGSVWTSLK